MTSGSAADPYRLRPEDVRDPPRGLLPTLAKIGPGMVLAASIVGSGELIATTTLGAQAGFAALWVVALSCLLKPVVQEELGRYTIATGETGLEGLDRLPGPRIAGVGWLVWAWALMVFITLLQIGAMFGGVSQVMNLIVPAVPVALWVIAFLGLTLALLLGGGYARIEGLAMFKVALFTLLTVLAAGVLSGMPHFQWADVAQGFKLQLPAQGLATAVAVFGITGVGASELVMYPYWCVEKGYARYAGPREDSPEWRARAKGWVRVMHVDIVCSMLVYTLATAAFYLLGAGVLHPRGSVPAARDMIPVLSSLYTETLGAWALPFFYVGAVATLYGTIFAATAAQARMLADMLRLLGFYAREDNARRQHWRRRFVVLLSVLPVILYFAIESPVKMVVAGGITQALLLPALGAAAVYLRHRRLPPEIAPPGIVTLLLWIVGALMLLGMSAYAVLTLRA
jgi:manganese transport protein